MDENLLRPEIKNLPEYVPGKTPKKKEVIKLASNENPLGPSPKALANIKKNLKFSSIYPDQFATQLREKLAEKLKLSPTNILVGNGSDEIMQIICATFLSARERVLIAKGTFSIYNFVTKLFDGEANFVELKNYRHNLTSFLQELTPETKIMFLCNPNNPTGTFFTRDEFDGFIKLLPKNVLVVVDEAYADFSDSKDFPESLKYINDYNVIVLRTFSKLYGLAGLRAGYAIASENLINYLRLAKLPFNVNRLAVAAATAALDDKVFVKKTLKMVKEGKKFLYKELKRLNLKFLETQANFIFVKLPEEADNVFLKLMSKAVIVRPLTSFGFPNAIRVTIGTNEQNKKFIKALETALKSG